MVGGLRAWAKAYFARRKEARTAMDRFLSLMGERLDRLPEKRQREILRDLRKPS